MRLKWIEILANAVKLNKTQGIIINESELKQTLFAVDVTFITDDNLSIHWLALLMSPGKHFIVTKL